MKTPWNIVFYAEEDGREPVFEYIFNGHNETDVAIIVAALKRLQFLGPALEDTDMIKRLGRSIWEVRKDRHRILYAQCGGTFVLLHAFLKKTQTTPAKEIALAEQRFQKWLDMYGQAPKAAKK